MITPSVFYKEIKKWVGQHGFAEYINFTGEEAIATNGWGMALVKNWKAQPHQEDINGIKLEKEQKFPDYRKVFVEGNDVGWLHEFKDAKEILTQWKLTFQYIDRLLKACKMQDAPVHLQKLGSKLTLYSVSKDLYLKFILCDNLEDGYDFESSYNVKAFLRSTEFLLAANTEKFKMYVGKEEHNKPFMVFETDELLLIFARILLRNGGHVTDELLNFVKNEQFKKW